jgi:hypothetical protein
MTNAEALRLIMSEHKYKAEDIADLIDVSIHLVKAWLLHSGAERHRPMKDRYLEHIQLKIKEKNNE